MSAPSADLPAGSADLVSRSPGAAGSATGAYAMAQAELRKLRHDYLDIFTRMVQPLLWLFVFGTAMRKCAGSACRSRLQAPTSRRA